MIQQEETDWAKEAFIDFQSEKELKKKKKKKFWGKSHESDTEM